MLGASQVHGPGRPTGDFGVESVANFADFQLSQIRPVGFAEVLRTVCSLCETALKTSSLAPIWSKFHAIQTISNRLARYGR